MIKIHLNKKIKKKKKRITGCSKITLILKENCSQNRTITQPLNDIIK